MSTIRTTELRKAIKMYEDNLGLAIEEEEEKGEVRFVFTQIDPQAPSTEFYFVVSEGPGGEHQSTTCNHNTRDPTLLLSSLKPSIVFIC